MECPEVKGYLKECGEVFCRVENIKITQDETGPIELEMEGVKYKKGEFKIEWHKDGTATIRLLK